MKRIETLTKTERIFAEEHHETVYHFLSYYGLTETDYYDVVIFGYLAAVQEYIRYSKLQRYAFSTIAWRQMKNALFEDIHSKKCPKRNATTISYQEDSCLRELDLFLPNRITAMEEQMQDHEIVLEMLSYLTPKEKEVLLLKADGYTYAEIAERCQLTIHGVQSRIRRFRKRLQNTPYVPHGGTLL